MPFAARSPASSATILLNARVQEPPAECAFPGAPGRGGGGDGDTHRAKGARVQDWIVDVVGELGVIGIGVLMFAENLFPPLPSEVIMPLAGYLSTRQEVAFWPAVLAGSVGSLAGATLWYWVGRCITREQLMAWVEAHGVWLAMTPNDVDGAVEWFRGHGRYSVLLGRLMPLVRTLISIPAGFSRMPLSRFLALSAVGTLIWTGMLTYLGRFLGQQFQDVEKYIGPVSWLVIVVAVVAYVKRVVRIRRAQRQSRPS